MNACKMTQLYVGNLSSEADEKVLRAVFGKYGPVREAIMKNGYAFVEFESPKSADAAMTDLHGKPPLCSTRAEGSVSCYWLGCGLDTWQAMGQLKLRLAISVALAHHCPSGE